jgi:hypothetical protein
VCAPPLRFSANVGGIMCDFAQYELHDVVCQHAPVGGVSPILWPPPCFFVSHSVLLLRQLGHRGGRPAALHTRCCWRA